MSQPRKTPFVTVQLTVATRDAVKRAALELSPAVGHQLAMSPVVHAALLVALRHQDELLTELSQSKGDNESD